MNLADLMRETTAMQLFATQQPQAHHLQVRSKPCLNDDEIIELTNWVVRDNLTARAARGMEPARRAQAQLLSA